jgi:hypothetical protein
MANKYMKTCSTILSHIGNAKQNYTEIHLTPVRMAIIKDKDTQKMLMRMWSKRKLIHCWQEYKLVWPLWKSVWRVLKKIENRPTT